MQPAAAAVAVSAACQVLAGCCMTRSCTTADKQITKKWQTPSLQKCPTKAGDTQKVFRWPGVTLALHTAIRLLCLHALAGIVYSICAGRLLLAGRCHVDSPQLALAVVSYALTT